MPGTGSAGCSRPAEAAAYRVAGLTCVVYTRIGFSTSVILQAYIVNYADDFVILFRRKAAGEQARMAKMTEKLKLEVNQQKTRVCRVPEESFDFLGYTLGRCQPGQNRPSLYRNEILKGTRPEIL